MRELESPQAELDYQAELDRCQAEVAHLRHMMDGAADALIAHDTEGNLVDVNERACQSLGYTRPELLTMRVSDIEADFTSRGIAEFWQQMQPGQSVTINGHHRRKDGSIFPVEVRVSLLSDPTDLTGPRLMLALVRDVSERLEQEVRLRQTEALVIEEREKAARQRAAELFRINQALTSSLDALTAQIPYSHLELDVFLQRVVEEVHRQIGASTVHLFLLDEVTLSLMLRAVAGDNSDDSLWHQPLPLGNSLAWRRLLETQMPLVSDFSPESMLWPSTLSWHQRRGHTRSVYVALKDGHLMGILALAFVGGEATPEEIELARVFALQATLAIQLSQLATKAGHEATRRAVVDERNRLARDIHDSLAQSFTAIVTHLEAARVVLPPAYQSSDSKVSALVERARDLARAGLDEARRSVQALRPQRLEVGGLSDAIREMIRDVTGETSVRAVLQVQGETRALPSEVEANLLGIAQEALSNALRHAEASFVTITLNFQPEAIELCVKDNGHGFIVYDAQFERYGFGLESMNQRATSLGGDMRIESQIGRGTLVCAKVPTLTRQSP